MTLHAGFNSVHAFSDDALGRHDATGLAEALRKGECSIEEVATASLERAKRTQPVIQGFVGALPDSVEELLALAPNRSGARRGPFHGVPTAIKDNTDVLSLPTQHGSAAISPLPAERTSPFAQQMLAQGFVCLGKSTLPEFGFNATTEPAHGSASRNPWNTDYSTGASSGGSAALVAAGVLPIAHANDGGGSIRIPAACCGLVGLKPTRGRLIDNDAAKSLPINIVADGVVTRSVRDTANFYAEAEHYFKNPKLPEIGQVEGPSNRPLRIGIILDSINGHRTDEETRQAVETTARVLERLGHHVETLPMPVPNSFPEDFALYWGMLAFGVRTNGRKIMHPTFDKRKVDGLTVGLDKRFKKHFYRLPAALWRLSRSHQDYARATAPYDAILSPVLGHTTPEIGHLSPTVSFDTLFERLFKYVSFTPLANTSGAPAIAIPAARTSANLPIGIQLMGRHGGERTLIELAYALEQEQPWPTLAD